MKLTTSVFCLAIGSSAAAQDSVLYEFDIRVTSNDTLGTGQGGELLQLPVGAEGTFSILARNDDAVFPSSDPGVVQSYVIESIGFSVNGVTAGGQAGVYPSQDIFSSLSIIDNLVFNENAHDIFGPGLLRFDHPDINHGTLALGASGTVANPPSLIVGTDLPLDLDLSLSLNNRFTLNAAADTDLDVVFEYFDVTITQIPTPGAGALLALTGLAAMRRRRSMCGEV